MSEEVPRRYAVERSPVYRERGWRLLALSVLHQAVKDYTEPTCYHLDRTAREFLLGRTARGHPVPTLLPMWCELAAVEVEAIQAALPPRVKFVDGTPPGKPRNHLTGKRPPRVRF